MDSDSTSDVLSTLRALLERLEHNGADLYDDTTRDAMKRMLETASPRLRRSCPWPLKQPTRPQE